VIFFSFSEITRLFFSVPMPTLIKASLISSWRIYGLVLALRRDRRLVQKVLQIRAGKSRRRLSDLLQITSSPSGLFFA
jgi:hypothetical protein